PLVEPCNAHLEPHQPLALPDPLLPPGGAAESVQLILFLTTLPPPTSTLFPYTTLFRSRRDVFSSFRGRFQVHHLAPQPRVRQPKDRKSTRLNSSHVAISYAVFCLKKKTRRTSRGSGGPKAGSRRTARRPRAPPPGNRGA